MFAFSSGKKDKPEGPPPPPNVAMTTNRHKCRLSLCTLHVDKKCSLQRNIAMMRNFDIKDGEYTSTIYTMIKGGHRQETCCYVFLCRQQSNRITIHVSVTFVDKEKVNNIQCAQDISTLLTIHAECKNVPTTCN
jgi:hypothetical protein